MHVSMKAHEIPWNNILNSHAHAILIRNLSFSQQAHYEAKLEAERARHEAAEAEIEQVTI